MLSILLLAFQVQEELLLAQLISQLIHWGLPLIFVTAAVASHVAFEVFAAKCIKGLPRYFFRIYLAIVIHNVDARIERYDRLHRMEERARGRN